MKRSFADELERLRSARGLTQKQLADLSVGVSAGYVALLETGQRRPSIETVSALATALSCSESERKSLFGARSPDLPSARQGAILAAPDDGRGAAQVMAAFAAHYAELNERVRGVADDLGTQWAGSSAAAYRERLGDWERSAENAEQALTKMAEALLTYAIRLEEVDSAVARSLED